MKPTTIRKINRQQQGLDHAEGLLSAIKDKSGEILAFGRTQIGQAAYDVLCSSMSGAEAVRRHPELSRDFVLYMRRKYKTLRRRK